MSEEVKQVICKISLRPRIEGKPVLILAGTPFDPAVVDDHTLEVFRERGTIYDVPEVQKAPKEVLTTAQKAAQTRKDNRARIESLAAAAKSEYGKVIDLSKHKTVKAVQAEYDRIKKEASAPKGHFKEDADELGKLSLNELDSLNADICKEAGLPVPEPFTSEEEGIKKLSGQLEG